MYISVILFVSMIGYMIYFQVYRSADLLESPYNKRQEVAEAKVVRGSILSNNGTALAETETDEEGNSTRVYPYGSLFAHTVGYNEYGGSGLEATQNSTMVTSHADFLSQVQQDLNEEKKEGDHLVTTLSLSLQQTAAAALGSNKGAVFVMDVDSGAVLADVSSPSFNPNTVAEDWETLIQDDSGVFLNRAMQGLYPPGSTFKIVTALAYLRDQGTFDNFSYTCTGTYESDGFTIHCAGNHAHGTENFHDAMANSCNCAFAYMSLNMISKDTLRKTAESFGFNDEISGLPLSYEKSQFSLDSSTANQLTMQTAIGQGDTLATPMQVCMIADAVANGGTMMTPRFLDRIESVDGILVKQYNDVSYKNVMTAEEAESIKGLLREVVQRGTASSLASLPYDITGKTGTAEYGDVSEGKAHSWFVGFSNTGNNDIVVCVIVEGGGNGIASATPIAGSVFSSYFGG